MIVNQTNREFVLQWHLTHNCDMRCQHCYIPNEDKDNHQDDFPLEKAKEIINEFHDLISRWNIGGRINFSGGNPLFHEDFFDIVRYTKKKKISIGILGNPTSVLDDKILEQLKEINVSRYQISVDGLEENHERIRGKGTFNLALNGIDALVSAEIPVVVLSTVTTENMNDMPELAKLIYNHGANSFAFSRLVPIGEGKKLLDLMPTPTQYRAFLLEMHNTYLEIKKNKPNLHIPTKDPLWRLLYKELGLLNPKFQNSEKIVSGCGIGIATFCIDVDGTTYSCRRLGIPAGNIFDTSLRDLFINSATMHEHRDYSSIDDCGDCDIRSVCRGCRAVAAAVGGSYTSKDPQCWKDNSK